MVKVPLYQGECLLALERVINVKERLRAAIEGSCNAEFDDAKVGENCSAAQEQPPAAV